MARTEAAERREDGRSRRHRPRSRRAAGLLAALALAAALAVAVPRLTGGSAPNRVLLAASGMEYSARVLEARPGEVEVTFANTDAVAHTFTVPDLGVDLEVASGEAGTAVFSAPHGTYRYVCTVPGHDGPGMRGELRVR